MPTGSEAPSTNKSGSVCQDGNNGPVLFNCVLFNACSIVNKIDNLALLIETQSIDIVLMTESKLDDSIVGSYLVNAVSVACNLKGFPWNFEHNFGLTCRLSCVTRVYCHESTTNRITPFSLQSS